MTKPAAPLKDIPLHEHQCTGCGNTMRHYSRNGCNLPREIECETCKHPDEEKEPEDTGRGVLADADDEE